MYIKPNLLNKYRNCIHIDVAKILDWGKGAQTRNHIGEDQKKRVFTVRFSICDWGARNLVGDQFWILGPPNLKLLSGDRT